MRISDWSSDVCSSDLAGSARCAGGGARAPRRPRARSGAGPRAGGSWAVGLRGVVFGGVDVSRLVVSRLVIDGFLLAGVVVPGVVVGHGRVRQQHLVAGRHARQHSSEEHTYELHTLKA